MDNNAMVSATEVRIGQILKLHGIYCAVVLDLFTNGGGCIVLRVQTLRNVFRGFGPELIDTSVAPDGLCFATMADMDREIAQHQAKITQGLQAMMATAKEVE